jgi:hypothetical protein
MCTPQPAQTLCGIENILSPIIIELTALLGLKFITRICETGRSSFAVIAPINFSLRWNLTMKRKGRVLHLHSMKTCKVTAGSSPFIRLVTRSGKVVDSHSGRFSTAGKNLLHQMNMTLCEPYGLLKHKNIVHLPGLDHRIYHLVAYSVTDTIIFLLNHISGPVHCMTAAGLYSPLLLQSFCLCEFSFISITSNSQQKIIFFSKMMGPDLD